MGNSLFTVKTVGLVLGPLLALSLVLLGPPDSLALAGQEGQLNYPAWYTLCVLVWMAIWWMTEPIPIPATSLLPLVALPLIDAGNPTVVGGDYFNHIVVLLLGGFIIAMGIERWNLHKRIALNIVSRVGSKPRALIFGFMAATALLSMWISNTATTIMMVPIALSAAASLPGDTRPFTIALLLGICYAASIGGVGTPIGTPTNLIAMNWLQANAGANIGFPQWMAFGIPTAALLVPAAWWAVTRGLPGDRSGRSVGAEIGDQLRALGRITTPEARAAGVFALIAFLWVFRLIIVDMLDAAGFTLIATYGGAQVDMIIAIFGAILMFLIPAGQDEKRALLNWQEAEKLPWGVLILFGGGIALGKAITRTGLSEWIGSQLTVLSVLPPLVFIVAVVTLVIFLTELTSNVATMTTLAPILGALALAVGAAPESLLAPAAVAASCAFMLPVATAPNAIIYATGEVSVARMMKSGIRVNLIGIVVISAIGYWVAPLVL
ncbi:sodium-dependent dicarboxylate transporter SdcS [Henriciella pelagia]|jgi:sodium-dependent dicarboxylate transporter 2/3/5|uniref:Sodium-dependent dicarboxylate transporter SdcS n=1 Tax=Henriciella pelagia TaxID=1977912 RepID=A0ABQ1JF68_9PROT|nr:sodium-dependent dicarboxylate transporter SdcS [Henriciella pelagia]